MNESIVAKYAEWLANNLKLLNNHGKNFIVTPILNALNDYQEITVSKLEDGSYCLSDEGETLAALRFGHGVVNEEKFEGLCHQYNLERTEDNQLISYCTEEKLPWTLHYMSFGLIAIFNTCFR